MANYTTDLKDWGAVGSEFPSGYSYVEGEQPVDEWDNFVNAGVIGDIQHLISLTNDRIESTKASSNPSSPEPGHLVYDEGDGIIKWWDDVDVLWHDVVPTDGATMVGGFDMDGNAIEDSSGTLSLPDPLTIQSARLDHDWVSSQQGGTVAIGAIVPIATFELADGEQLDVTRATLTEDGFTSPVASGVSLMIVSENDNTTTVLSGDGSTLHDDETGNPLASYTNGTGASETVMIGIDNGQYGSGSGDEATAHGSYIARKH